MSEITSELLEVSVDTDATVEIDSKLPEATVDVTKSITAEIQPENYVLTSGGIYTGNMTGATPTWLLNAIQQQLTTGDGNVMSVLDDMRLLLDDLQLGVNQAISQIENTNTSMSALETSLASRIDENDAAILDVYATKVTATEAQAIATTAIETTFDGNVDAYIGNLASVYTAPGSATATNIATLQASYNDQTARIDSIEYATTDEFGYSLGASKLGTAPDGSIVGWQFTDGTGVQSEFKIQAEKFSISNGTTGYTPFSIAGSNISFNGLVSFSNVTNSENILLTGEAAVDINNNTTTIDGDKITTGSITSNQIAASTITSSELSTGIALINGEVKSSDFTAVGGSGFRLKSNAAGTYTDPSIYGAYIRGGYVKGTTIEASSFVFLTDAGYITKNILSSSDSIYSFTGTNLRTYTINTNIYSSNAVTAYNNNRLSKNAGCIFDMPTPLLARCVENIYSVSTYKGTTLLGSYTFPKYADTSIHTVVVGCFTFEFISYEGADYDYVSYLKLKKTGLPSITGEGSLKIVVTCTYGYSGAYEAVSDSMFLITNF